MVGAGCMAASFNPGLPTVAVFDLKYHNGAQVLLAATHGRGCWVFDMSTGLPIQLASITATAVSGGQVRVEWVTLTETNNYGFEVQKSDGNNQIAYHGMMEAAEDAYGVKRSQRGYGTGSQILACLNLKNIRLLTNHPRKIVGLEGFGIKVVEQIPIDIGDHISRSA